jgi:hypothetical protein
LLIGQMGPTSYFFRTSKISTTLPKSCAQTFIESMGILFIES